ADAPTFQRQLRERDFHSMMHSAAEGPDVRLAMQAFISGHSRNWSQYSNSRVDELILRMITESGEALGESISEIEQILLKDMPRLPAGALTQMGGQKNLRGIHERGGYEGSNDMMVSNRHLWFEE